MDFEGHFSPQDLVTKALVTGAQTAGDNKYRADAAASVDGFNKRIGAGAA